jgi:polyribonucleotide nucleotidyltransferase
LQVSLTGSKSWILRFSFAGRSREMGLGNLATRTLAQARDKARDCRQMIADGIEVSGSNLLLSPSMAAPQFV